MFKYLFITITFLFISCGSKNTVSGGTNNSIVFDTTICDKRVNGQYVYNTVELRRSCIDNVLEALQCIRKKQDEKAIEEIPN